MTIGRREGVALAVILSVGLLARIVGLDAGLWYDEIFTLTHYVRAPLGQVLGDFSSLNNHMFYSLQAKAAVALFGESAWALRLPALLFGIGSIAVLWAIARRPAGIVATLFAAWLMAISYHHVWFSQNARGYTGMLFWTSLATLLLVAGLRTSSWRVWIGYGVCVAAGIYTHLSAGFFFASHAVVYAVAWVARRSPALGAYPGLNGFGPVVGFAVGGLLTALLYLPLLAQIFVAVNSVSKRGAASSMGEWVNPLRTATEVVSSVGALGPLAPVALVGGLILVVLGGIALWRRAPVLVGVYALSIPLTVILLIAVNFRIWPRYFFVDIGFVLLCVAKGAEVLCRWIAPRFDAPRIERPLFAASVVIASTASLVLLLRNYAHPKQDFGGAMALIASQRMPGDTAASFGLASDPVHAYFAPDWPVIGNDEELTAFEQNTRCVWLVTAFDDHANDEQRQLLDRIKRTFSLAKAFDGTLGGGTVKVYHKGAKCPNKSEASALVRN